MKLKEYSKNLAKLAKKYPDFEVIYSKDDEGNDFRIVHFGPSLGSYEDREFVSDDGTEEYNQQFKSNAVCIN